MAISIIGVLFLASMALLAATGLIVAVVLLRSQKSGRAQLNSGQEPYASATAAKSKHAPLAENVTGLEPPAK